MTKVKLIFYNEVMNQDSDNWKLNELFHFDEKAWNILNDTNQPVEVKGPNGASLTIAPGMRGEFPSDLYSIILPNSTIINYSDQSSSTEVKFSDRYNLITSHLLRRLKDGHVIEGLNFLDYHYKWTSKRKRLLLFIKDYILTSSWSPNPEKDKFKMYVDAVQNWVDEKEKTRKRTSQILVLLFPLIVFALGAYFSDKGRDVFIGAFIGGLAAPVKEIYELFVD